MGTRISVLPTRSSTTVWWWRVAPYVFMTPFFIIFGVFGLYPLLYALWISVHDWQGLTIGEFIGFGNFARLFRDPALAQSLVNTALIGITLVPLMTFGSLLLASLVHGDFRGRKFYRTSIYLPVITSLVAVGIVFGFLFSSPYSPVMRFLGMTGLPEGNWLTNQSMVKPLIVIVVLWRWIGYNMIIMLAGLQTISQDLYEAARIDGASRIRTWMTITVPLMARTLAFSSILSTIAVFNLFDEVFILFGPGGGPGREGLLPGVLIYRNAFENIRFGYASAMAYGVGLIIVALSLIQLYFSERASRLE
jgi:ABC-type sugar transport system permease subunit